MRWRMVKLQRLQSKGKMPPVLRNPHLTVNMDQPLPATVTISKILVVTATGACARGLSGGIGIGSI
eukprot:4979765-Prorocentrum_lima.AAC.1